MMRTVLYIVLLGALFFVPLERMEIANLEPIQAVWMYEDGVEIILETDTEDRGVGRTVREALDDMKQNSTGIVYLDTAQYLFVADGAETLIDSIRPFLKGNVQLCLWDGQGALNDAIKYADSRGLGEKLRNWERDVKLPNLSVGIQREKGEMPY